jgi:hypothetical protein
MTHTTSDADSALSANKALAVGWLMDLNQGRIDAMLRTTGEDWQMHGGPPQLPSGAAGLHSLIAHIGPVDQTWAIDDVVAEGDRVVVRATNTCVQESFLGLPAAGVRQVFTATFTFRIADGLVHEIWRNADDLGRVLQLGATLTPPHRAGS